MKRVIQYMQTQLERIMNTGIHTGIFLVGIQLLQKYGYVSMVNWDKLGNDTSTQLQHWTVNIDVTNVHSLFHTLGIPVAGFVRTR